MSPPFFLSPFSLNQFSLGPFSLGMPHWPKPAGYEPPGTPSQRARALLEKLGHPELRLPPVIHVGGTKGKGSTIALLRAMLEAAGYKVHCYTSPHIERFNERILLAGHEIGDDFLFEILEKTRMVNNDAPVGFFDATTAAAMLAFSEHPADILLMEMGLGGHVDATNIIDHPLLTVLTTLSYDHMEYMGGTLEEIAAFECGILKPGVTCISSYQHPHAQQIIRRQAALLNLPLYEYGTHWLARRGSEGMFFADAHGEVSLPLPSLLGAHQIVNAGNAIAIASALEPFDISEENIITGLMQARWKGRLERLACPRIPEGGELWFDGGHNMAAAQAISLYAYEYWQDKPFYLIFGTTQGKDIDAMLKPFALLAKRIYAVAVKSEPKSYSAQAIASQSTLEGIVPCESIEDCLYDITCTEPSPFRALVFGSLYLWLEAKSQCMTTV